MADVESVTRGKQNSSDNKIIVESGLLYVLLEVSVTITAIAYGAIIVMTNYPPGFKLLIVLAATVSLFLYALCLVYLNNAKLLQDKMLLVVLWCLLVVLGFGLLIVLSPQANEWLINQVDYLLSFPQTITPTPPIN